MPKKVVFFNHFHNGDIHVSRGLVRQVMDRVKQIDPNTQFYYTHRNSGGLLQDIPGLVFDGGAMSNISSEHTSTFTVGDAVYFNTWYAQQQFKYMNRYGLTFDALYSAFDANCKSIWGFSLDSISSDPSIFFPIIDYNAFQIGRAKSWLTAYPGKKIFVSNGAILSDQAYHFALTPIIDAVAKRHPDKIFILSNKDGHQGSSNIVHSSDIIRCPGNDLNENSFLASHCDVIIGKASGAFSFSVTQQNLFQRDVKFLAFCNLAPVPPNKDFWVGELLRDKISYKAKFIINNSDNVNVISHIIDSNL